jgi:hypothetical protein
MEIVAATCRLWRLWGLMELERLLLMGSDTAWLMALEKENDLALACWLLVVEPNGENFLVGGSSRFCCGFLLDFLEKVNDFLVF